MELVIGDGLIGRGLYYHIRKFDEVGIIGRGGLDLSKDGWEIARCDTAYICAGETSTERCEKYPIETRVVNVENTIKLASKLRDIGAHVVWISSERVFDGSKPYRKVGDEVCPITEYGRQKAEAEEGLLELGVGVVRFSKVIGWEVPLFEGWVDSLRKGLSVYPYADMSMSPLPVWYVVEVLRKMGKQREEGLYQVSGLYDITYDRIAYHIANHIGADIGLVQPTLSEVPHRYTTLESNLEDNIPDVWETIYDWCRNRRLREGQWKI